jgi:hypothetical protein
MSTPRELSHAEAEILLHALQVRQQGEALGVLVYRPTATEWVVGGEPLRELAAINRLAVLAGYQVR